MFTTMQRATLFALYQVTLVLGITLFPLAMLGERAGLSIPIGRLVESVGQAYEGTHE